MSHAPIFHPATVRGDEVTHNGQLLRYIGSGRFTSAYWYYYRRTKRVRLFTYYSDSSKEIVINARNRCDDVAKAHLPQFKDADKHAPDPTVAVYDTEFVRRPILSMTPDERDGQYTVGVKGTVIERDIHRLKQAHKIARKAYPHAFVNRKQLLNFNKLVVGQADILRVTVTVIDALEALMYAAESVREWIMFDSFRPSNVGIDSKGTLVLSDPMFDYQLLQKHLTTRRKICRVKSL